MGIISLRKPRKNDRYPRSPDQYSGQLEEERKLPKGKLHHPIRRGQRFSTLLVMISFAILCSTTIVLSLTAINFDNIFADLSSERNRQIHEAFTSNRQAISQVAAFKDLSASRLYEKNDEQEKEDHNVFISEERFSAAVYVQVDHAELWDEMLTCIINVVAASTLKGHQQTDVYVSIVPSPRPGSSHNYHHDHKNKNKSRRNMHLSSKIATDLENIPNIGQVVVKLFENEKLYVKPFMEMLDVNIKSSYDAILKMHTKQDNVWRERVIESLCATPEQVVSILEHFRLDEGLDMIAPQGTVMGHIRDSKNIFPHIEREFSLANTRNDDEVKGLEDPEQEEEGQEDPVFDENIKQKMNEIHKIMFPGGIPGIMNANQDLKVDNMLVIAGNMFWIRYSALHPKQLSDTLPKLNFKNQGVEHALERLFATEIALRNRRIAEIPPAPRPLAFYFPQYHPFPENDPFWGKGTHHTEWSLLRQSDLPEDIRKPLPTKRGGLGYYNLMSKDVRKKQTALAKQHGVNGFIFQHYWFSGNHAPKDHLAMHQVYEQMLLDGEPNLPFAFSWANGPLTKKIGDEEDREGEDFGDEDEWREHFEYLLKFFNHRRYIYVDGKPLFILHRIGVIGVKLEPMLALWRKLATEAGLPGIYFVNTIGSFEADENTVEIEKDAGLDAALHSWPQLLDSGYHPSDLSSDSSSARDIEDLVDLYPTQYWGSFTGFDMRPVDDTAESILRSVNEFTRGLECSFQGMANSANREIGKNFYFIDSWNGWNEQAILEPDDQNEFAYIEGLSSKLQEMPVSIVFPESDRQQNANKREIFLSQCETNISNDAITRAMGGINNFSVTKTDAIYEKKKKSTKISLVISYYETSLNWMGDYFGAQDGYQIGDITIISKNQETDEILGLSVVEAIGESIEIIYLPNVGRCDHSYAYWIKERLPKLNKERDGDDVVMFLKDNNYDFYSRLPRTFGEVFRTTVEYGFGCFSKPFFPKSLMFFDRTVLESFWIKSYERIDRDKTTDTFKSKYSSLKDWRDQMGLSFPKADYVPVCFRGFFSTKKRGLFSQTQQAWENMEKNLSRGNNIQEGHFAERAWASLVTYTSDDELQQLGAKVKPYIDHIFDVENKRFDYSGMVMLQDCDNGSKKPCI